MSSTKTISGQHPVEIFFRRTGLWLIVIALALHLIGSTCHKHKLATQSAQSGDSVSCFVAGDLLTYTRSVVPGLFTKPIVFFSPVRLFPVLDFVSTQSFFIPLAQAPPQDATSV